MRVGDGSSRDGKIIVGREPALSAKAGAKPAERGPERVEGAEPSPFQRILHGLGREVDRGETIVRRATASGSQDLGNGDLLALQAGVYRYSEAVDLSAKLVDRATSGVKTVLQGQ